THYLRSGCGRLQRSTVLPWSCGAHREEPLADFQRRKSNKHYMAVSVLWWWIVTGTSNQTQPLLCAFVRNTRLCFFPRVACCESLLTGARLNTCTSGCDQSG
ncbi:hypothetical protein KUCAC02_031802, partial [Chaenocephalus aceratus]